MAHMQVLVVVAAWLLVLSVVIRRRVKLRPHEHWLAGLETMRRLGGP